MTPVTCKMIQLAQGNELSFKISRVSIITSESTLIKT